VIDDALQAVSKQFRQEAPEDVRNLRLCNELDSRVRQANAAPRGEPIPWASPPERTPLGVPVEWLAGFRRVGFAEDLENSDLWRNPGRFAIACGLALAGIQQAAIKINLLSTKQQGVLRRAAQAMRSLGARSAWGVDLGLSGLKAVKIAWNGSNRPPTIEAAAFLEYAKPLSHSANETEEMKLLAETLKTFVETHEIKAERLCVGLPGRLSLCRQIDVPPSDSAKAAKLVQFEAPHQFPFPLEQLFWDFQLFEEEESDSPSNSTSDSPKKPTEGKSRRALLIAAKRATIERYLDAFEKLDIRIELMQPDFLALHNFLVHECFDPLEDSSPPQRPSVIAAIDIGCDVTNFVVSSPSSLWYRSCGVAGQNFTRGLVKEFQLSVTQAEKQKLAPESAKCLLDFQEALLPVFDDLLAEVRRCLATYAESRPDRPVQRLYGVGGGFAMHGLFRYLRCGR
jgi:type IV pilus assembly protein PilM